MRPRDLTILLMLLALSFPSHGTEKENILIINSYHSDLAWVDNAVSRIFAEFKNEFNIHVYDMDTKRIDISLFQERADIALSKVEKLKPRLVFLGDDNALRLLGPALEKNNISTIYFGINNNPRSYFKEIGERKHVTGVLERPLIRRSIVLLKDIKKDLKKVRILFDNSPTSAIIFENIFNNKNRVRIRNVEVFITLVETEDQWHAEVKKLKELDFDIMLMSMMHRISASNAQDGNFVGYEKIAKWSSRNSPIPIFGFWDVAIGKEKAVGGYVLSGEMQGYEAVKIAREILGGISPGSIFPRTAEKGRFKFSKYQLTKWQIELPADVLNQAEFID